MGGTEDEDERPPRRTQRGRGEGSVWQDKKTGQWWYAISENGKQRKFRAPDQPTARARLKELLRQKEHGIAAGAGRITVQQHLQTWMDIVVVNLKPKTQRFYRQIAELYLIPYLGRIKLEKLSPEDVIGMLNAMRRADYAEQTIDHVYTVGKTAMGYAVKWRKILYNPFAMVDAPEVDVDAPIPLNESEAAALLVAVADHRLRALYYLALILGIRKGELLGLRWEDLDLNNLEHGTIAITQQVLDLGGTLAIGTPKSKQSRRTLPLTPRLVVLLQERAVQIGAEREADGWQEHGLIFPSEVGTPMSQRNLDRHFKAACVKAKIRLRDTGKKREDGTPIFTSDLKFHHLRHTCLSWLGDTGANKSVIQAIAGHANQDVTDRYVHVRLDALREAIVRMEQVKLRPNEDE